MLDMRDDSLRARLRRETAVEHDRLDAAVSSLDLSSHQGFSTFIAMQEAAFASLVDADARGNFVTHPGLVQFRDACRADLATLGRPPARTPEIQSDLSPLAVDHIVLGSRLGTAVLQPCWRASTDPRVQAAKTYFGLPRLQSNWRLHCHALEVMPACGTLSQAALDDTRRLFDLFAIALTHAGHQDSHV